MNKTVFHSKWFKAAMAVVIAVVYCIQISNVFDRKIDLNGDNVVYYNLARSLSNGTGYCTTYGLDGPAPHLHFPPGYPAFVSVLMDLGFTSAVDVKTANCVLLLISILLLYAIILNVSGNVFLGAAVCIAVSFHAEILRWATIMMSEQLFLLLSLLIIFLLTNVDESELFKKGGWKSVLFLAFSALLLGYMYLVRTMGACMSVAAVLYFVVLSAQCVIKGLKRKEEDWKLISRYVLMIAVLFVSVMSFKVAWDARNKKIQPGFRSEYVADFNKKGDGENMGGVSDWTERIVSNTESYLTCYIPDALFEKEEPEPVQRPGAGAWILGIFLVALISYGLLRLGRTGLLMFLYCAVTYAVLMIWPEQYSGIRYFVTLLPILILGLFSALFGLTEAALSLRWKRPFEILPVLPAAVALCFMVPSYVRAQDYYHKVAEIKSWGQCGEPSINQFANACEWAAKNLPANSRMMCRKPELYYVFSHSRHSASFPQYATPQEVMNLIDDQKIEFVIIDHMYPHAYKTIMPAVSMYPDRFEPLYRLNRRDAAPGELATYVFYVRR